MTTTLISGIDQLKSQLLDYLEKVQLYTQVEKTVLFFSYGEREERCKVWNSAYSSFSTAKAQLFSFLEDRKSTRLNSSHMSESRMPSSA